MTLNNYLILYRFQSTFLAMIIEYYLNKAALETLRSYSSYDYYKDLRYSNSKLC